MYRSRLLRLLCRYWKVRTFVQPLSCPLFYSFASSPFSSTPLLIYLLTTCYSAIIIPEIISSYVTIFITHYQAFFLNSLDNLFPLLHLKELTFAFTNLPDSLSSSLSLTPSILPTLTPSSSLPTSFFSSLAPPSSLLPYWTDNFHFQSPHFPSNPHLLIPPFRPKGLRIKYELHHGVSITDEALDTAVELSARYMPERRLPDKVLFYLSYPKYHGS